MIVDTVSPTPFALLRRTKHFEYRDDDRVLKQFSDYEDPVQALTDECQRVLKSISSANDSSVSTSKTSTSLRDASWSRFEDVGFGALGEESDNDNEIEGSALGRKRRPAEGLRSTPRSKHDHGRPTTPSWADFLSTGFVDEPNNKRPAPLLLPPDKVLPPLQMSRTQTPQTQRQMTGNELTLEPGELASITSFALDDTFWWVWITSLAGEEPLQRKAVFGRCALIETNIRGGRWLIMEEIVQGAAPEPEVGAYIAEKKSRFGFSTKSRMTRSKSTWRKPGPVPKAEPFPRSDQSSPMSKSSIAPSQHARIQAAAAALQHKNQQPDQALSPLRRAGNRDGASTRTNSVFTLQPVIMTEAAPAMKWANSYDKDAIRAAYLGNNFAGRGSANDLLNPTRSSYVNTANSNGSVTPIAAKSAVNLSQNESHEPSKGDSGLPKQSMQDRELPSLPPAEEAVSKHKVEESLPTPTPAPLPVAPPKDIEATNQAASEAAQVPLPSITTMEHARSTEQKPLPPPKAGETEVHEQVVQGPTHESTNSDAMPNAFISPGSSPESKKSESNKLKKKNAGGGFKGLFGRKKAEVPSRRVPMSPSDNSTAVAAARAALQGPQRIRPRSNYPQSQPQSSIGRRLSGMGRKKTPNYTPIITPYSAPPNNDMAEEPPMSSAENTPVASPRYGAPPNQYEVSQASISRIDSNEQRHAEREFHTFDQGPLEDQPAFVPEDSPDRTALHSPKQDSSYFDENGELKVERLHDQEQQQEQRYEPEQNDNQSEASVDLSRQISPVQDRWAQIRKNAAERAARPSEEQSGRTARTDRTDDADTSGEESK